MTRPLSLALALILLSTSTPALADSSRVQSLLANRSARLLERLQRWDEMCMRRAERRSERLARREGETEQILPSSIADKACTSVRKKLTQISPQENNEERKTSNEQRITIKPSETKTPKKMDDQLPNQLFTPTYPLPTIETSSKILVLGESDRIIGSIELNPRNEPIQVREIQITLSAAANSLTAIEIFDELGFELGSATVDLTASANGDIFTMSLSPKNAYHISEDDEVVIGFRARLKSEDEGGASGESVQISDVDITAIGYWTSREVSVTTEGPDFKEHVTALTTIDDIQAIGKKTGTFSLGSEKLIGSFRFAAKQVSDADADPRITDITFSVSTPSEVTIENPILRDPIAGTEANCTFASLEITCSSIPSNIGSIDAPRDLSVYADVSLGDTHPDPFLQLEINDPGGPSGGGSVTWTDGTTSFSWVPFGQPVARGTSWE